MGKCTGCEKEASQFQCPLCQAEEAEGEGFFCSQECFSLNWIAHRDGAHKGGTVKAGAKRKRLPTEAEGSPAQPSNRKGSTAKKDESKKAAATSGAVAHEAEAVVPALKTCKPWAPLPDPLDCDHQGWAVVKPPLTNATVRAVISLPAASFSEFFWSCAIAAARFIANCSRDAPSTQFVVVGGSPLTTHAFAWALRCSSLIRQTRLVLSTTDDDMKLHPDAFFSQDTTIVLTSVTVLRANGKKAASNLSQWMDNRTLIVLPDVSDPEALQTLTSKGIFFVSSDATTQQHAFEKEDVTHTMAQLAPIAFNTPVTVEDLGTRFDNQLSTHIASGNLLGFLERVINIFSTSKNRCEELLTNALFVDWGCVGGELLAHHKLAYIMRYLADHSDKFAASSLDLVQIATRTVGRVARCLPHLVAVEKLSDTVNLQLQATVCYLYPVLSTAAVDSFGAVWGFTKVVEGPAALEALNKLRKDIVAKIRHRCGAKLGTKASDFLVILMHFLYDLVSTWSLSIEEVDNASCFTATLAHEVGSLDSFLRICNLYGHSEKVSSNLSLLSGHQKKLNKEAGKPVQSDLRGLVHPPKREAVQPLPFSTLPVSGRRQRKVEELSKMALDEILMAMPRQPIPMYIGDVGNLIGIWTKFNAKYDGALGYKLSEFLEANPESFKVVGNVVTRIKAGAGDQVKLRYDNDREDGSDDEDDSRRKRRDRNALTGLGSKTAAKKIHGSAKARKKAEKKERNAARYNKNRQAFDPEKKVPGYVKHGPRRLKGRGRKANIRNFKRPE